MDAMSRRTICLLLVIGGLFGLSGASCFESALPVIVPVQPGDNTTDPGSQTTWTDQVIEQVNAVRASNSLQPLAKNDLLTQAAQAYAERMADLNFLSHTDPETGSLPWDRAAQVGYHYSMIAENIAGGQPTPQAVMDGWMNSPSHSTNILSPTLTEIGVGVCQGGMFGIYWVQLFGTPG